MTIISASYTLLFLPLLASLLCQISPKKNIAATISIASTAFCAILALFLFKEIWQNNSKIFNDFSFFPISLALEFSINLVDLTFLLAIIFLKIFILFYYKNEIAKYLNEKNSKIFYAIFCITIFAASGIALSNNLINLYLFFEIYNISFLAFFSIAKDKKITKSLFKYFYFSAAASLIILFCFLIIYLNTQSLNLNFIKETLKLQENETLLKTVSLLIFPCIIIKFFPFYLYFSNLKTTNLFANFLTIDAIFIKANLGLFFITKFYYLFFSRISISLILIAFAITISFFSAIKIFQTKHLKIFVINLFINNFSFILIALSLKNKTAIEAAFFYWLNCNLLTFFLFIFATFLKRKFGSSTTDKIALLTENKQFSGNNLLLLSLKLSIIFIASFPFSFLFFANFNLSFASLEFSALLQNHFAIFISPFVITSLFISQFCLFIFAIKILILSFENQNSSAKIKLTKRDLIFHALAFFAIIFAIYFSTINANFLQIFSSKFADLVMQNL